MRDEVLTKLVDTALDDPDFRARAREDLDAALTEYGFDLEPEEHEAVREFHGEFSGLADPELQRAILDAPRRQGGG